MPEYPYEAFRQHLGGKVQVMLGLAPNGKVASAVVFRSDAADVLQRAAVHAGRHQHVQPRSVPLCPGRRLLSFHRELLAAVISGSSRFVFSMRDRLTFDLEPDVEEAT